MYNKISVTGMVLSSMPVGESDRRITILTRERGKISAFARGARKATSPLLACSQMFAFGEFFLYEGRDAYNVESAELRTSFPDIQGDMESLYYGMYFAELALFLTRENIDASDILNLLFVTFRAMEKNETKKALIRRTFELRILTENGEMPEVYSCIKCHHTKMIDEPFSYFDPVASGLVCRACNKTGDIKVSRSLVYTLQYIVSAKLEKLYGFSINDEVFSELEKVMRSYLKVKIGREMKSEEMLSVL